MVAIASCPFWHQAPGLSGTALLYLGLCAGPGCAPHLHILRTEKAGSCCALLGLVFSPSKTDSHRSARGFLHMTPAKCKEVQPRKGRILEVGGFGDTLTSF